VRFTDYTFAAGSLLAAVLTARAPRNEWIGSDLQPYRNGSMPPRLSSFGKS
jgi:hypothetical protein